MSVRYPTGLASHPKLFRNKETFKQRNSMNTVNDVHQSLQVNVVQYDVLTIFTNLKILWISWCFASLFVMSLKYIILFNRNDYKLSAFTFKICIIAYLFDPHLTYLGRPFKVNMFSDNIWYHLQKPDYIYWTGNSNHLFQVKSLISPATRQTFDNDLDLSLWPWTWPLTLTSKQGDARTWFLTFDLDLWPTTLS